MKTTKLFLSLIALCLLLNGCTYDENTLLIEDLNQNEQVLNQKQSDIITPRKSKNELIIKYKKNTADSIKNNLRNRYKIVKYKTCDCSNKRIEKWVLPDGINIEETKDDIAQEGGVEGGGYQFLYPNENDISVIDWLNQGQSQALIKRSIKPASNIAPVTVAIIDTGINLNVLQNTQNPQRFLYNTSSIGSSCKGELSGWDFVNNDNNTFDDNGHGTTVANIIMKELKRQKINNYQILPVKAFKKDGTGTTFDILCGYLYAVSKSEVSVINMSFGWYRYPSDLLSKFIGENSDILHITSAGNNNNDNDDIYHFPSSITNRNVLSIGSYHKNKNYFTKSDFSNYGKSSVDFLSKGENILTPFPNSSPVKGTSYAAPLVTAKAMKHYYNNPNNKPTPHQTIQLIRNNAFSLNNGNIPDIRFGNKVIKP